VRIVIASTYVPFIKGGADTMVESLRQALCARGFQTDTVYLPLSSPWPDLAGQTAAFRLLDLTESCGDRIDRLITVRYPSYALRHPNKVAWFIHHYREAYDLWGTPWGGIPDTPKGREFRDALHRSDNQYLGECRKILTNSRIVADRLRRYNGIEPDAVLYPPLPEGHPFRPGPYGDYLLYVSRLTPIKRQTLAIEAMKYTRSGVRLVIGGTGEVPDYLEKLRSEVTAAGLGDRVRLPGWVSEERKAELMAGCCGALYLAYQEDSYGYVTLEAFHCAKPVITLTDSGGPLEVIRDGHNGYVAEPDPRALAEAMDRLWLDRVKGRRLGDNTRATLREYRIDWDHVVENLTA
jgi:glycosyltransferase involved in cell wall biosynthesis